MRTTFSSAAQLIEHALASEDEAWPEAERALLEAAERGVSFEAMPAHPDPVARQMARAAVESTPARRSALEKATSFLERAQQRFARTPVGYPPIAGVVANLTATFGGQLAGPLSLRLAQQSNMPHWQAMSTLAYLDRHRDPTVVASLVRFAAQTSAAPQQELAVRILGSIGGSSVAASVRTERDRVASRGGTIPPALAALAGGSTARA
jgi:hypothetical protein